MVNISNPVYFDLIKSKVIKKSNKLDIISNKTRDKNKSTERPSSKNNFFGKIHYNRKYYSSISRNEKK